MKDCKGHFKVVRVIREEHLLADNLNYEDAISIMDARAKDQISRNYSYEVRDEKNGLRVSKQAHGEA